MDNLWIIYGSGWWLTYPSEKYEFVNWDDDIPNSNGKIKNVPNHQPVWYLFGRKHILENIQMKTHSTKLVLGCLVELQFSADLSRDFSSIFGEEKSRVSDVS